MDLVQEIFQKTEQLKVSVKKLRETGTALATAEKEYKIVLCEEVLKLKEEKIPATLIQITVYGKTKIADLRFKRDVAEVIYKSNQEAINSLKLQLRILESQYKKEYGADLND